LESIAHQNDVETHHINVESEKCSAQMKKLCAAANLLEMESKINCYHAKGVT